MSISNLDTSTPRFTLLTRAQVMERPQIQWLIPNVLRVRGLASIYGASQSGKTFLALDLAQAIANGDTWFGLQSKITPVVYVCLEGEEGMQQRVKAWEGKHQPYSDNFMMTYSEFDLANKTHVSELADTVKSNDMSNGVIVIDTLNASVHHLDENSSRDMSSVIDGLKSLRDKTGCAVIIIHHAGKDVSKGMRGHSSLHAAMDTIIVVKGANPKQWVLTKNKDAASGGGCSFKLPEVVVGAQENGEPITSCVIDATSAFTSSTKVPKKLTGAPKSKNQKLVFDAFHAELLDLEKSNVPSILDWDNAIQLGANSLMHVGVCKRKTEATSIINKLVQNSYFDKTEDNKLKLATVS